MKHHAHKINERYVRSRRPVILEGFIKLRDIAARVMGTREELIHKIRRIDEAHAREERWLSAERSEGSRARRRPQLHIFRVFRKPEGD